MCRSLVLLLLLLLLLITVRLQQILIWIKDVTKRQEAYFLREETILLSEWLSDLLNIIMAKERYNGEVQPINVASNSQEDCYS